MQNPQLLEELLTLLRQSEGFQSLPVSQQDMIIRTYENATDPQIERALAEFTKTEEKVEHITHKEEKLLKKEAKIEHKVEKLEHKIEKLEHHEMQVTEKIQKENKQTEPVKNISVEPKMAVESEKEITKTRSTRKPSFKKIQKIAPKKSQKVEKKKSEKSVPKSTNVTTKDTKKKSFFGFLGKKFFGKKK